MSLDEEAKEFDWLLNNFVKSTGGVTDAVAVSADGLLIARSDTLELAGADQLAAMISGFVSLGDGTTRSLDFEVLTQIIVAMKGGYLFVSALGAAGCLGVVAEPGCDIGNIGYQMTLLVERAGRMLTPELIVELKNLVLSR